MKSESHQEIFKHVGEVFIETGSIKATAAKCAISEVKVRRILITLELWSSPSSQRIKDLLEQGFSTTQIAETLHLTVKAVEAYMPYRRGVYGLDHKSVDALRSELYRSRQRKAARAMQMRKGDPMGDIVFFDDYRKMSWMPVYIRDQMNYNV